MRAWGANRLQRPLKARVVIGLSSRRSEPMCHHCVKLRAVAGENSSVFPPRSGGSHLPEVDVVLPDGPDDAGELVGEGDGGLVVTAEFLEMQGPDAQTVGGSTLLGSPEDGACAVDEEHAKVDVAALADGTEAADETAGAFTRGQPEVAGEVTAGGETLHVPDEGNQGGGGEETDAGDGAQAGDGGSLVGECLELVLDDTDAALDVADLGAGGGESRAQSVGQTGLGVGEQVPGPGENMVRADGDGAAELAQQTADGVEAGGSSGQPGGAQAVQSGQGLLGDGLHGNRVDVLVAECLQKPAGIGAVGLVAKHVGPGGVRREQNDTVADRLEPAGPVVRRAAGFKKNGGRRLVSAELHEAGPGQPLLLADLAGSDRHRHLENFLGHIDGDGGRFHGGLLLL